MTAGFMARTKFPHGKQAARWLHNSSANEWCVNCPQLSPAVVARNLGYTRRFGDSDTSGVAPAQRCRGGRQPWTW